MRPRDEVNRLIDAALSQPYPIPSLVAALREVQQYGKELLAREKRVVLRERECEKRDRMLAEREAYLVVEAAQTVVLAEELGVCVVTVKPQTMDLLFTGRAPAGGPTP